MLHGSSLMYIFQVIGELSTNTTSQHKYLKIFIGILQRNKILTTQGNRCKLGTKDSE